MLRKFLTFLTVLFISVLARAEITGLFTFPDGADRAVQFSSGGYFGSSNTFNFVWSSGTLQTPKLQLGDGMVVSSSDSLVTTLSGTFLTQSSATVNFLTKSSATATYVDKLSPYVSSITAGNSITITGTSTPIVSLSTAVYASSMTLTQGISATTGTFSGPVYAPSGSNSSVGIGWANDPNTGFVRGGADNIVIVTGGLPAFDIGNTQVSLEAGHQFIIPSGQKVLLDGSGVGDTYLTEQSANVMAIWAGGLQVSSFTGTGAYIRGTTTNDNAGDAWVGYSTYVVVAVATNTLGTGVFADLTSVTLTAGDWDVTGTAHFANAGATWTGNEIALSTSPANNQGALTYGDNRIRNAFASGTTPSACPMALPNVRFSLNSTTTVYLKYQADFSSGNPQARGRISARRMR